MTTNFTSVYAQLDELLNGLPVAIAEELGRTGGGLLRDELVATSAFEDDTGATRAGFVSFAYYNGREFGGSIDDALSEVEALNPGQGHIEVLDDPGDTQIVLVATSPTRYEGYLEGQRGGANSHLGPAMDKLAGRLNLIVAGAAKRFIE